MTLLLISTKPSMLLNSDDVESYDIAKLKLNIKDCCTLNIARLLSHKTCIKVLIIWFNSGVLNLLITINTALINNFN
jgi:hypothetical protein